MRLSPAPKAHAHKPSDKPYKRSWGWTFEQLRELRLTASIGDDHEYLIPTLEEALQVCKERTTIRLDKFNEWDWDTDIYPLIQKTGAWRTCFLSEYLGIEKQEEVMAAIKAESGMDALRFYILKQEKREGWVETTDSVIEKDGFAVAIWRNPQIKLLDLYVEEAEQISLGSDLSISQTDRRLYLGVGRSYFY